MVYVELLELYMVRSFQRFRNRIRLTRIRMDAPENKKGYNVPVMVLLGLNTEKAIWITTTLFLAY